MVKYFNMYYFVRIVHRMPFAWKHAFLEKSPRQNYYEFYINETALCMF